GVAVEHGEVGVDQHAPGLRRAAHHQRPARDLRPRRDQGARGDDGLVLDHHAVEHDGPDSNEAVGAHPCPVKPDGVPKGHVVADLHRVRPVDVDHRAILVVVVLPDTDAVDVGPEHIWEPDALGLPQLTVADDLGSLFHERRFVDAWCLVLERSEHPVPPGNPWTADRQKPLRTKENGSRGGGRSQSKSPARPPAWQPSGASAILPDATATKSRCRPGRVGAPFLLEESAVPAYDYRCDRCDRTLEVRQRISEAPLTACDRCGGPIHRLLSAAPFILKGGGWYVTDYPSEGRKKGIEAEKKSSSDSASSTSGS